MSFSCSVSFSGLSENEKQSTMNLFSQISLNHQEAMAEWFMEQQYQEEKMKIKIEKEKKRIEQETKNRLENERLVEQYFKDEKERNFRCKIRDKKLEIKNK